MPLCMLFAVVWPLDWEEELPRACKQGDRCQGTTQGCSFSSLCRPAWLQMDVSALHCSRCCRVNTPDSIELAMAGVCAAILVAACQDTAVELLTWPGRPRPAAIAITGVSPALWPACRHRFAAACACSAAVSARVWAAVLQASSACQHAGCGFGPICSAGPALERAKLWAGRD